MPTKENIVTGYAQQILSQVRRVVVGKDSVLLWVLAAILAKGHILLEDVPGVGKTTMALAFSRVLDLGYSRVQFTPDVLPSDVTGYSVLDQKSGKLQYQPGAVLCNLFLADELNRATSRTQSALLEAMEEGQVTVDGTCHPLPQPFVVIATQNPTGAAGTQLLPDSQMDRFMVRLSLGYPSARDEATMVLNRQGSNPLHSLSALMTREQLTAIQEEVEKTFVNESIVHYIVSLRKSPGNPGSHRHGKGCGTAPGTGLRAALGCPGSLCPYCFPPADSLSPGTGAIQRGRTDSAGNSGSHSRPQAALIWPGADSYT